MANTDETSDRPWLKARELAEREGVVRSTIHLWHKKGVVEKRVLGPKTGVRFRLVERDDDD